MKGDKQMDQGNIRERLEYELVDDAIHLSPNDSIITILTYYISALVTFFSCLLPSRSCLQLHHYLHVPNSICPSSITLPQFTNYHWLHLTTLPLLFILAVSPLYSQMSGFDPKSRQLPSAHRC